MNSDIDQLETQNPSSPGGPQYTGWQAAIARYFKFGEYRTNFRIETLAGLTTFMTMAYILVVNPLILSDAIFLNQPRDLFAEQVFATAISAAVATLVMAFVAKYPFALAPGMGLNAFFAYSVVLTLNIDWRLALSAVFVEGLIFIALTLTNVRRQIIDAIPLSLKTATSVGIGLFIAYIGLSGNPETGGAGIIVGSEVTTTTLGSLQQPNTLLAIAGIFITTAFLVRRIKGALLWGILATALLGWILGNTPWPTGIVQFPTAPTDLIGQSFVGFSRLTAANFIDFVAVLLVFLFVDLFDTVGTLAGVSMKAGYIKEDGQLPRVNQALFADAVGTTFGAIVGTSTVTTYAESAAGVSEGGRTGFAAVITGILFVFAIFLVPIFEAIPAYATTPALVITGVLMMAGVLEIRWGDPAEAIPAFLTIFFIPLSYSIATGLSVGFITYPIAKTLQGKAHEVTIATWILAAIFIARFVFMTLRFGTAE
ncbi:NCS2 family permease [Chroococcidiopsis sp. TS-821]|uniref:NCS2 family permease n=1 Tax=Chroococcidiopsis sp. TS-821 TaxID=1378066 RepID=UPI000CEE9F67|nr:NCS2 family permease [Chroococcidiopsis sp. TS-821]PPS45046.1 guanine permease [Chroococcidiopsis sp. TS-821]